LKQVTATVVSNSEVMPAVGKVMPSIHLMWLDSPEIAAEARPGQFVMVRCGEKNLLRRPLSIHRIADKKSKLALLYSVVGKGTYRLTERRTGDNIDLLGPLGNGFSISPVFHNLLLVAGGMGFAPLFFLAEEASNKGHSITIITGARTTMVYLNYLSALKVRFVITTEDGTGGQQGIATDLLPDYIDWADQVFACGPIGMYKSMYEQREKLLKTKPVQVSLEVRMGCGFGVCYGCTVKTKGGLKQVCKDGPVFNLDDVLWGELGL